MSLKATKKIETNRYELEIVIDGEKFRAAINDVYRKNGKKINVPGFRKGKAPLSIIEKFYGVEVFFEDALNLLYADAVEGAAKEANLKIVDDKMDFDLVSISKEDGVCFKVALTTYPEVEVSEYKGLKAERVIAEVTDAEVEATLNSLAERNSRMVAVTDRAAALGDTAVIDFEGFVDDVAFEGGKGESHSLELGSGQFIPGFEEQIVGHNTGDEFDVNVEFPAEYHAENLAGKPAVFKVKLHEIKVKELPALDDEFAKDASEFDTLDELKADIKAKTLERKQKANEEDVENQLVNTVVEGLKGEIPEALFENRVRQSVQEFDYRLQSQGMNLQMYMQYTGSSIEEFSKTFRPQAEQQVKMRLALEKIVELEKIVPTAEELEAKIEEMAKGYGVTAEQVKAAIPMDDISLDLAVSKAIDLIKDNAVITDVKEKTEKKPAAKKTTTKKAAADGEKKPAAKKTTTKKAVADGEKKPAAKKTTTKKAAADKE
ncbi:MAG: trigger factor [Ruminococcaceae bacterium]|nr:trigger factor [Oscillospiraceae bacterium]MBQ8303394.1 trigger factor [Clostridia bacterium]